MIATKRIFAATVALLTLVLATGCSATVNTDVKNISSCHSYTLQVTGAKASIQQTSRGSAIQWGIYVSDARFKDAHFKLSVYAGGVKIDSKDQWYEPHASVNTARATKYSGQILRIAGTGTKGDDYVAFDIQCRIM